MTTHLTLGDLLLDVHFKDVKHVHLAVQPPYGRVTVSAPARMSLDTIRVFAITKMGWIRRQQRRLRAQERETRREFLNSESHFVWGKRYLLQLAQADRRRSVALGHNRIVLTAPATADAKQKGAILADWYRRQIRALVPKLISRWEPLIGVKVSGIKIQRMKTKWGSCNPHSHTIILNTELAKKPKECLEYVLVHEMVHMLEPTHNKRFTTAMDRLMPNWRLRRDLLNEMPLGHDEWK